MTKIFNFDINKIFFNSFNFDEIRMLLAKKPISEMEIYELTKEKCHSVGNLVIAEMCQYFGETLPPAISERINKKIEEFCNDKNN